MPFEAVPILPVTGGQKEDQPEQLIDRVFSSEIRDIIYNNGKVSTRGGLTKEFTDDLLNPVKHMTVYKTFSGDEILLMFTTKDIYQFDATNNDPLFITPTYTTGTIDVTNGSKTVAGNGTLWDTTVDGRKNVRAGDYIRIGGINDASPVWYEVDSVTNDTSLELVIAYAESTDTTVAYTNRQAFATTSDQTWRSSNFTDGTLGDVVIAVNGPDGDFPVVWDGSGQMVILKNASKGKEVKTLAGRLLIMHTLVSGSNQTQRYEWSAVGDAETWGAADFADITETQGKIVGAELFGAGNHIIIGKNDSKFQLRWVGGDFTFDHQLIDRTGVLSAHGMENIPGVGMFYFGSDLRFRIYNGATDQDVGKSIFPSINSITPANFELVYSKFIPHKKELRVHAPIGDVSVNTNTFVMRTDFFSWWPWEYQVASAIACTEVFSTLATLFVDDSPWADRFVDEFDGFWDDREFLENSPVVYYGGDDNKFRRADEGLDDDGVTYTPRFQTKNDDFGHPQHTKRLWKYQLWADSEVGKSLNVSVRRSDAIGFEASKSVSIDDTSKDVVKVNTPVFDAHGNVFETKIEATPPWTLIGLWAYIKRLRKTI